MDAVDPTTERHVDVVPLRQDADGQITAVTGCDTPLLLSQPDEPTPELLGVLLASATTLTVSSGVPAEVVALLTEEPIPAMFRACPWLREHRVVVFVDGRWQLGEHTLRYDEKLGIYPDEGAARAESAAGFDLLTEPWVPVVDLDGRTRTLGLARLVLGAHRIRRIAGDTPPMTAALHRLVLALLHRVYGPATDSAWATLWQAERFPAHELRDYLRRHGDRFDLFHPRHPFIQCTGLRKLPFSTAAKLVAQRSAGNNATLFDHTTADDHILLMPAEAARWLVTVQAFDPGGMKTPAEKDKSSQRAPCNYVAVALVEGADLKETLLLNSVEYWPEHERPAMTTPDDHPVWERPAEPPITPDRRSPRGWTDLLTWPSRRILLSTTETAAGRMVDGVVLTPGTRLEASLADEELMAAFRRPNGLDGKPRSAAPLLPVRLHPVRGVWRHSVPLLMTDLWEEGRSRQRPRTLDHISQRVDRGHLRGDLVYTLRIFGQQLDSNASVIEAWLEEQVPAPVALLRAQDERLGALIGCAIALADDAGGLLRAMHRECRQELRAEVAETRMELDYWPNLARPFARFLRAVADAYRTQSPESRAATAWCHEVGTVARATADRWAEGSSARSHELLSVTRHHVRFLGRMRRAVRTFQAQVAVYATPEETS